MVRVKSAALAGVVAFVLAACSSAGPSAGGASPTAEPTPTPAAQQSDNGPSYTSGAVADLEALIPDTIGGITMVKQSMKGSDLIASGSGDPAAEKFLQDLGVSPDSIAIAFGYGISADGSGGAAMFVFRATGAGQDKLLQVFKDAQGSATATDGASSAPMVWQTQSIGGKQVQVSTTPEGAQTVYLYATNDLLFEVAVNDLAAATAVIATLP